MNIIGIILCKIFGHWKLKYPPILIKAFGVPKEYRCDRCNRIVKWPDKEFDTISTADELRKAYEDTPFLKDPKSIK